MHARTITTVNKQARRLLDALDHVDDTDRDMQFYKDATSGFEILLRELVRAISAITAAARREDSPIMTAAARAAAAAGNASGDAFTSESRLAAEDWLLWSALRMDSERAALDQLSATSALLIVPGLLDVLDAFPADYSDLDQFIVLRAPLEELDGYSPIRWLLTGGDIGTVVTLTKRLGSR
jgi:hypothetical protein